MKFEQWEPVYETILQAFGYPREADEAARDELARLVEGADGRDGIDGGDGTDGSSGAETFDLTRLASLDGATVAVAGGAPTLSDEVDVVAGADFVIAASTAADVLVDAGVPVDLMTTDLDKNPETAVSLTRRERPVAVHAHGDNREALARLVPRMATDHVLPTTQAAPSGPVRNFGGFTDGDRAAFLADHFGAAHLVFAGWDFDDPSVDEEKRRKLAWAERLLGWLERSRGEQFGVLDGRRESLDLSFVDGPV